jgi:hypothetical protein
VVSEVLAPLQIVEHFVEKASGGRRLLKRKELIERWVEAYTERLKPKLFLGRYGGERGDWWEEARPEAEGCCWGARSPRRS